MEDVVIRSVGAKKAAVIVGIGAVVLAAIAIRVLLVPWVADDFTYFFGPWSSELRRYGLAPFSRAFADYQPAYLYLLYLTNLLPIPTIWSVKIIPIVGDLILAWITYALLALRGPRRGGGRALAIAGGLTILFVPTVVMNSSMWGQCDVLFTAALVATVYYLAAGRSVAACVAYGIAFSLKLQAILLAPVLLLAWLVRRVRFRDLLWIPGIHLLTLHPAAYLGRPIGDLLTIYLDQSQAYKWLQMRAPNIYQWFPDDLYDVVMPIGVAVTAVVVAGLIAAVVRRRPEFTTETWVSLALLFALVVPSVLPGMHERYFYAADVFSVIYAFSFPRRFLVAVVTVTASTMAYIPYLFGRSMPLKIAAIALLGCVVFVVLRLRRGTVPAGSGRAVSTPALHRDSEESGS